MSWPRVWCSTRIARYGWAVEAVREKPDGISVGWCSQEGPLEKTGELRVRFARLSRSIVAKVHVDGVECEFSASLTDVYTGLMACPDKRPVQILLWLR